MDRMKDSGSFDWGSTPHGRTKRLLTAKGLQPFFISIHSPKTPHFGNCGSNVPQKILPKPALESLHHVGD